jgi:hypothetical protein
MSHFNPVDTVSVQETSAKNNCAQLVAISPLRYALANSTVRNVTFVSL